MYDLISVGSATLDVVVKSSAFVLQELDAKQQLCFEYGAKMDVEMIRMVSGGGATNVAVGASRLGLKTLAICEIGKDFAAQLITQDLQADHVDTSHLISERSETTAVSVLLTYKDGGRTALTHRGAAYQLESRDIPWDILTKTRWLHLGTLGGNKSLVFDLFDFAKQHQLAVSWTPSLKDLALLQQKTIQPQAIIGEVIVMNDTEWQSVSAIQDELLNQVRLIVITKGEAGGIVYAHGKKVFAYQSLKVDVVEETGAGDAFTSAFISALIQSQTIQTAVEWGKQNAASVIQHYGAKEGLLTKIAISNRV